MTIRIGSHPPWNENSSTTDTSDTCLKEKRSHHTSPDGVGVVIAGNDIRSQPTRCLSTCVGFFPPGMWSAVRRLIIANGFRARGRCESCLPRDPSDFRQQKNPLRNTDAGRTAIVIAGTRAQVALVTNRSSFVRDSTATQSSLGHPTNMQGPTATEKAKWREHRLCRGLKCLQIGQSLSRWVYLSNRPWVVSSDVWPPIMVSTLLRHNWTQPKLLRTIHSPRHIETIFVTNFSNTTAGRSFKIRTPFTKSFHSS